MLRVLENKVRRLVGAEVRDPGFFVMHMPPPYAHEGGSLHEYRVPWVQRADDFMVACWRDVGEAHNALYDALNYYMWEHTIVEREVILKTRSWAGRFIIEKNSSESTLMVLEVPA